MNPEVEIAVLEDTVPQFPKRYAGVSEPFSAPQISETLSVHFCGEYF
jgi:hypothetical protein